MNPVRLPTPIPPRPAAGAPFTERFAHVHACLPLRVAVEKALWTELRGRKRKKNDEEPLTITAFTSGLGLLTLTVRMNSYSSTWVDVEEIHTVTEETSGSS